MSFVLTLSLRTKRGAGALLTRTLEDVDRISDTIGSALSMMATLPVTLFDGTVAENIAYGKTGATREEVERAAKAAYADRFISLLPKGYDTPLSDATALSGGQKQLLTIARAFLSDKPILILDEATSDVDTRTETYIQKTMDKLQKHKTSFVIAHRLSTIVHADTILAIDKGKIVDVGTHEELLKTGGFYAELWQSQYANA